MKTRFLVSLLIFHFSLLILAGTANAHIMGQPPFFKINGKYSDFYPVQLTSLASFILPQDLAPKNYLVGEKLNFEIDTKPLPAPLEVINKTIFEWDFGDHSSKVLGLQNTHTYTQPGSYELNITAQYGDISTKQLFQSVLINVVPSKDYQLPHAVMTINGSQFKDPKTNELKTDMSKPIQFDAVDSVTTGKIISYFWDFGDGESSSEKKVTHQYFKTAQTGTKIAFAVLRIKTDDGFISDNLVQISHAPFARQGPLGTNKSQPFDQAQGKPVSTNFPALKVIGIAVLFVAILIAFLKYRKIL